MASQQEAAKSRRATKAARGERLAPGGQQPSLEKLLELLHVDPTKVEYVIVGDGSGTTWEKEFGWTSTLIDRTTFSRMVFHGAMSHGTNNMAELLAVLHPLLFLSQQKASGARRVHILSDSNYIVTGINQAVRTKSNRELWMAALATRRQGLILQAHWIPRNVIALNKFADGIAGACRKRQARISARVAKRAHGLNPSDE